MLTKNCEQCGKEFPKPASCSLREWNERRKCCSVPCSNKWKAGRPTAKRGKTYPSRAKKIPCRICGKPTKYNGTKQNPKYGLVNCGSPICVEESRKLKNKRISQKALDMYASGERKKIHTAWANVPKVSKEEALLTPWFTAMGWESQYKFLTGVHTNRLPRMFRLDFALPEHKLYIEIDGSVHRFKSRKERDARRDRMMAERGWEGLRIDAQAVKNNPDKAKKTIKAWIDKKLMSTHNRTEKIS